MDYGKKIMIEEKNPKQESLYLKLIPYFDKYGILAKKDFYDITKMDDIKFSNEKTEGLEREQDFIYSFLSSMRRKMFKK